MIRRRPLDANWKLRRVPSILSVIGKGDSALRRTMNVGWVRADQRNVVRGEQTIDGAEYACSVKPPAPAHRETVSADEAAASSRPPSPAIREKGKIHRNVVSGMQPHGNASSASWAERRRRTRAVNAHAFSRTVSTSLHSLRSCAASSPRRCRRAERFSLRRTPNGPTSFSFSPTIKAGRTRSLPAILTSRRQTSTGSPVKGRGSSSSMSPPRSACSAKQSSSRWGNVDHADRPRQAADLSARFFTQLRSRKPSVASNQRSGLCWTSQRYRRVTS